MLAADQFIVRRAVDGDLDGRSILVQGQTKIDGLNLLSEDLTILALGWGSDDPCCASFIHQNNFGAGLAGYHWFGDWGRDTMSSLPGLTVTTGRHDIAAKILRTFANYVDQGMLPNRSSPG